MVMATLVMFGRGVLPIALVRTRREAALGGPRREGGAQGTIGIVGALEGFYGARMRSRRRLFWFAVFLMGYTFTRCAMPCFVVER